MFRFSSGRGVLDFRCASSCEEWSLIWTTLDILWVTCKRMLFYVFSFFSLLWDMFAQDILLNPLTYHSIYHQNIKHPLQPLPLHDVSAHTGTLSERGSLPKLESKVQLTKHQGTAAGSGEFSFFWSLDTVIASIAASLRETIPREQIRDLPFTVKTMVLYMA